MSAITIHTDGASRGNPGAAAIAYVIQPTDGAAIEHAETIGQTTNNQAEYRAMVAALERLSELAPSHAAIEIFSDSELMVRQITGVYKVKDALIRPHHQQIMTLISGLKARGNDLEFTAIRRHLNERADELANQALDAA